MQDRDYIERALTSEILRAPERFGEFSAVLKAEDFSGALTREIFSICRGLYSSGKQIDLVSIRFGLNDTTDEAWTTVTEYYSTPCGDIAEYARMLKEQRLYDTLAVLGLDLIRAETLAEMEALVGKMSDTVAGKAERLTVTAETAAHEFFDRMGKTDKPDYLRWGFPTLDRYAFTEPGDFVAIGGYPSSGKTMFALQVAAGLARHKRVGFFSLETSPQKVTDRLMCHLSRVPMGRIKTRELSEADWKAFCSAGEVMTKLRLDIIPASGMGVQEIEAVALNKQYDIIFVDYLQIVDSGARDRYENVTQTSLQLHRMAQSHKITVVALAQFKRPDKTAGKKPVPPSMADFRESGQIEQDIDLALLLYPADPNDNRSNRICKIGKNKEGERAQIELEFNGSIQTFSEKKENSFNKLQRELREFDKNEKREREARQVDFEEITAKEELPF